MRRMRWMLGAFVVVAALALFSGSGVLAETAMVNVSGVNNAKLSVLISDVPESTTAGPKVFGSVVEVLSNKPWSTTAWAAESLGGGGSSSPSFTSGTITGESVVWQSSDMPGRYVFTTYYCQDVSAYGGLGITAPGLGYRVTQS